MNRVLVIIIILVATSLISFIVYNTIFKGSAKNNSESNNYSGIAGADNYRAETEDTPEEDLEDERNVEYNG